MEISDTCKGKHPRVSHVCEGGGGIASQTCCGVVGARIVWVSACRLRAINGLTYDDSAANDEPAVRLATWYQV